MWPPGGYFGWVFLGSPRVVFGAPGVCFWGPPSPGDGVSVQLQELEQLLRLLAVPRLLLGRQRVVGHQQRVGAAPCTPKSALDPRIHTPEPPRFTLQSPPNPHPRAPQIHTPEPPNLGLGSQPGSSWVWGCPKGSQSVPEGPTPIWGGVSPLASSSSFFLRPQVLW